MTKHMRHTQPTQLVAGMLHTSQQCIAGAMVPPASLIYKDCCVHSELKEPHLRSGQVLHS